LSLALCGTAIGGITSGTGIGPPLPISDQP